MDDYNSEDLQEKSFIAGLVLGILGTLSVALVIGCTIAAIIN